MKALIISAACATILSSAAYALEPLNSQSLDPSEFTIVISGPDGTVQINARTEDKRKENASNKTDENVLVKIRRNNGI